MVVLATTTAVNPSLYGTRGRSSHTLTASPPTDAVGVTVLTASPARRARQSVTNETRSWGNAKRHPSVSKMLAGTQGNTRTRSNHHDIALNALTTGSTPTEMTSIPS